MTSCITKTTINLWDALPKELTDEICDYNKIPYLDELRAKIRCYLPNPNKSLPSGRLMSVCDWIDHKRHRQDHRNLYGDCFYVYKGKTYYPCGEDVIKMMKINKLRIRKGMKTRTMINHLIKV
tara:strand:- start:3427 stop:3795 length:369 start_codon:yes stop_codon:yes gene_type:complete